MNELKFKAAFHTALQDYHLSDAAVKTLSASKLVLLNAPSAGGRNTIIAELVKTGDYQFVVSDTTRLPRSNNGVMEQDGIEYWFRDEADMLRDIEAGEFLEAEVIHEQQVSGISVRELARATADNKIAITDVEIGGIANVVALKPDTVAILVLPPSFAEWQRRMLGRSEMPLVEQRRRLQTGVRIFKTALSSDFLHIVVNDKLSEAVREIDLMARMETSNPQQQSEGKRLAQELLTATEEHLAQLAD